MSRKIATALTAFAVGLGLSGIASADAVGPRKGGVVTNAGSSWGNGACAWVMIRHDNGTVQRYAIWPLGDPQSQAAYNTFLAAYTNSRRVEFYDNGPAAGCAGDQIGADHIPLAVYPGF